MAGAGERASDGGGGGGGQLRICAVTWNMNKKRFPKNLEPLLAPLFGTTGDGEGADGGEDGEGGEEDPCDVFVVGVQEAPAMEGFVATVLRALG